jgi:hypothetical protein
MKCMHGLFNAIAAGMIYAVIVSPGFQNAPPGAYLLAGTALGANIYCAVMNLASHFRDTAKGPQ